ncbi:hypothetical protein ACFOY8_16295 [Thalassospira xianhensis]|uniref:hypothetical protein n=1 Tax=Thalassospira xianhensis TaxID=478503 RepID=UPI0011BDF34D|nr:hypothetical protein [Thalassospira xianhensis]UKV13561.1 hypothetical protein L6172_16105 [Thalassospiraceae bacterium SW-3-3]
MTTTRITQKTYEFLYPFNLAGFDLSFPPGYYNVETEEEILEGLSFVGFKRISTTMYMIRKPGTVIEPKTFNIDPRDFDIAVLRDRHQCSEHQDTRSGKTTMSKVDRQAIERSENEGMSVSPRAPF